VDDVVVDEDTRTTWQIASASRMLARNIPQSFALAFALTIPVDERTVAGVICLLVKISASVQTGIGSGTAPALGSIVAKG
jgi:hypothetical protein